MIMGNSLRRKISCVLIAALVAMVWAHASVIEAGPGDALAAELQPAAHGMAHDAPHDTHAHHQHDHQSSTLPECLADCVDGSPDAFLLTAAAKTLDRPDAKFDFKLLPPPLLEATARAHKTSLFPRGPPDPPDLIDSRGSRIVLRLSARLRI